MNEFDHDLFVIGGGTYAPLPAAAPLPAGPRSIGARIAKEGRNYRQSPALVTQRPSELDSTYEGMGDLIELLPSLATARR